MEEQEERKEFKERKIVYLKALMWRGLWFSQKDEKQTGRLGRQGEVDTYKWRPDHA